MTQEEIMEIANEVTNNIIFCTKEVLTSDEAAAYMGISKSYLYKLTMKQLNHITSRWVRCVISTVRSWKVGYRATKLQ